MNILGKKLLRRFVHATSVFATSVLLLIVSHSAFAELTLPLEIDGRQFTAILNSNDTLLKQLRISGAVNENNQHYTGHFAEVDNSWLRISNIDGHWQGIASVFEQTFVIDSHNVSQQNKGKLKSNIFARSMAAFDHIEATCALDHAEHRSPFFSSSTSESVVAKRSALELPQLRSYSELCANKVDDGNGGELCLIAELELAFDPLFQTAMGANAASQAVSLVNIVDGIYRRNFNVSFETLTLKMLDNNSNVFSNTTAAGSLLNDIANKKDNDNIPFVTNKNALFHFVTGRNFDGSTVGVAYLRSLCASATASGTSQLIGSGSNAIPLTALVVAHELGHNFGSGHDGSGNSCGSGFLMGPSLNSNASDFSSCSKSMIDAHISGIEDSRFLAPLNACFNFPVDLAISAANGNPSAVTINQPFAANFVLQPSQAAEPIASATLTGASNGGAISSASVGGQNCQVASNSLSFNCTLNNVTSQATAAVQLVANATSLSLSLQTNIDGANLRDIVETNNDLQVQFTASGSSGNDTTPNAFSFSDQTDVAKSQLIVSNTIAVSGINAASPISITGGEYSIDNGTFTSAAGIVNNGNSVRVRHTTPDQPLSQTNTVLTIGGISDTFSSTTAADVAPPSDTTPEAFTFTDVNNVATGSLQTSNSITIDGINTQTAISVSGGSYSVNGQAFVANDGTVVNGDTVRVRHNASASPASRVDTELSIGGVSDTFTSTTTGVVVDNSPNDFSFSSLIDVPPGTQQTSAPISITGVNTATSISINGGEYSINNGAFTSQNGQVSNNDSVRVRHTSSAVDTTRVDTELAVGNKTATFSSTTRATQISNTPTPPIPGTDDGGSSSLNVLYLSLLFCVAALRRKVVKRERMK